MIEQTQIDSAKPYKDALERLLRAFQGDWPTIDVPVDPPSRDRGAAWYRLPVDDETRDAIVHARKLLEEDTDA